MFILAVFWLPFLALAAGGVKAGLQAGQAANEAKALREQGRYKKGIHDLNSRISLINAKTSELQAEDAIRRGDRAVSGVVRQGKVARGAQRTAAGASGVSVGFGSAATIQEQTALDFALDGITAKNNAWREAWGYKMQGVGQKFQALNQRRQGELALKGGTSAADSTLLTGGINAFSSFASGALKAGGF